jgi:uncharacterized protein (TIGR00251 family)
LPSCRLEIRAIPNAPRNEAVEWMGDVLKVRVRAPAIDGKANAELCVVLAELLGLPKKAVRFRQGETSRRKIVEIVGLSLEEVRGFFSQDPSPSTNPRDPHGAT